MVDGRDRVAAQYAGRKAALRPVYHALLALARRTCSGFDIVPKKDCVVLRRTRQFAVLAPGNAGTVDVLLTIEGAQATRRLEELDGFNSPLTHRVRVARVEDADDELGRWLRRAWERA